MYGPIAIPYILDIINSLAPGTCGNNLKSIIFKLIILDISLDTHCEVVHRWMHQNLVNNKSAKGAG